MKTTVWLAMLLPSTTTADCTAKDRSAKDEIRVEGACEIVDQWCVASPNHPDVYGSTQSCTIHMPALPLSVVSFDTDLDDGLKVRGQWYSGGSGPDGVVPTAALEWKPKKGAHKGWKLCAQPFELCVDGPCQVRDGCVTSPNYPANYSGNERCVITQGTGSQYVGLVSAKQHHGEFKVNGQIHGQVDVAVAQPIVWSASSSGQNEPWMLCEMELCDSSDCSNHSGVTGTKAQDCICLEPAVGWRLRADAVDHVKNVRSGSKHSRSGYPWDVKHIRFDVGPHPLTVGGASECAAIDSGHAADQYNAANAFKSPGTWRGKASNDEFYIGVSCESAQAVTNVQLLQPDTFHYMTAVTLEKKVSSGSAWVTVARKAGLVHSTNMQTIWSAEGQDSQEYSQASSVYVQKIFIGCVGVLTFGCT